MSTFTNGAMMLSTNFLGHELSNPFVIPSGLARDEFLQESLESNAGVITFKTCTLRPYEGNPKPNVHGWQHGVINAIGLQNPGVMETAKLIAAAKNQYPDKVLIASIAAEQPTRFTQVASVIATAEPDFIELNLSCPNVEGLKHYFTESPKETSSAVSAVRRATNIPIIVKLGPTDNIIEVGQAAISAGAQALCAINTLPGLIVDLETHESVLSNVVGGISGPALKPVALRCVYELSQAVSVPIIGVGGISNERDALEMLLAGSTLVGVATAAWHQGITYTFEELPRRMESYLKQQKYESLNDFKKGGILT